MSNYGIITDLTAKVTTLVQSADAADMQDRLNAAIAALGNTAITSIALAGAGDGHTFAVLMESATAAASDSGLAAAGVAVRCYLAGTAEELAVAQLAAGDPAPVGNIPFVLVDAQMAGASKGTRLMGLSVYSTAAAPVAINSPLALATVDGALLAATANVMVLTSVTTNKFSIVGTKALKYDGNQVVFVSIDVDLAVQLTAADAFPATVTVDLVTDPLGTPVVLATQRVDIALASYVEDVGLTFAVSLTPTAISAVLDRIGIIITTPAGGVGSVLTGQLRVLTVR